MRVIEYGQGNKDTLVLLHGGGLSWWNYQETADILSDRFHIVIPVLDGHSGSDRSFTSIENNAREVIAYIDEKYAGHVLLMGGLSLGGQILLEILSQRNEICEFAVVESALALPMKKTAALIRPALTISYPLIKRRWFSRIQFQYLRIKPELFEKYYEDTAKISRNDMIAFLGANADYRIKETLAGCKARTFVLAGSRETPIMRRSAALIAESLPASQLEILQGFYHGDLSINHAEKYAAMLLRLIDR